MSMTAVKMPLRAPAMMRQTIASASPPISAATVVRRNAPEASPRAIIFERTIAMNRFAT